MQDSEIMHHDVEGDGPYGVHVRLDRGSDPYVVATFDGEKTRFGSRKATSKRSRTTENRIKSLTATRNTYNHSNPTMSMEITIAVPTHESLKNEGSVEVDEPQYPDGSEIAGDITAVVSGRIEDPDCEVYLFVLDERGSKAVPAKLYESLKEQVEMKMYQNKVSNVVG